jgi:hypothetical protein
LNVREFLASHRGRRLRFPALVALIAAAGAPLALGGTKPSTVDLTTGPIAVEAVPLANFDRLQREETRFGKLAYRGGVVLTSPSNYFGGWSGLALDEDGKGFFAVSDAGIWMSGKLTYSDKGGPSGMEGVRLGAIQSKDGDPLSRKGDRDAEGLALFKGSAENGSAYISFERKHRIARFDIIGGELSPAKGKVFLPKSARSMPSNGGFEAVAVLRGGANKGKLVAFSESRRDKRGNYVAWIWEGKQRARKFYLTNDGDYDVTDAAPLPDGGLLVLERRFRFSEGVRMRLRLISAKELKPGAVIDAAILVAADGRSEIDNMEGIATHAGPGGETIVTMISDDNYNHGLQRTVLLQFAISAGDLVASSGGSKADQP